jgi:DNA-binding transcriptional ArsR family regulator
MSLLLDRSGTLSRRGVTAGAGAHRRGEHELLRRRDLELVGWLGEQYGARTDQLETLLDCGPRTVQRILSRLRDAGLVTTRRLLVGEPAWVIPTSTGLRAAGHGFGVWQPRLGLLAHVAAVNEVRLHVQARSPESEWVSERVLARERQAGEHLPDGVVLVEGQRVAIEVELTVKSQRRLTAILDELTRRFDPVLYFCAAGPHRQLTAFAGSGRWPTLGVRQLPARSTQAP